MAQPGLPTRKKPMERKKPMKKKIAGNTRRVLDAEGRMQQGQTGGLPIDVSGVGTKTPPTKDEADAIKKTLRESRGQEFKKGRSVKKKGYAMGGSMKKKGFANGGMMKKKGFAMGGAMKKKGMAKGGKVRGAGIARKGVRPAKMR